VLIPVKALVMNTLSLGATFGALVWIFQDGHLSSLLGFQAFGAIEAWIPVIVFAFAFGLSMDYEVFLLSRIKEAYNETGDTNTAVAAGLQRSGRIITSAAFLVIIVFLGFAAGQSMGIKEFGLALAIAVAVDATLVRMILVPAAMTLLGPANWWAPAPLRRLHQRLGLHETPAHPASLTGIASVGGGRADEHTQDERVIVDRARTEEQRNRLRQGGPPFQLRLRQSARSTSIPGATRCTAYPSTADLPIPASPRTTNAPPTPPPASASTRSITAHSRSRPSSCTAGC
jgi:hypothetical protein